MGEQDKLEKVQAKIRKLAKEGKVEFAPQDNVELLQPYINRILEAIGHPEAWVSDMSSIGDFRADEDYQEYVNNAAAKLGIGINKGDYIVDIAMRLKALEPDA